MRTYMVSDGTRSTGLTSTIVLATILGGGTLACTQSTAADAGSGGSTGQGGGSSVATASGGSASAGRSGSGGTVSSGGVSGSGSGGALQGTGGNTAAATGGIAGKGAGGTGTAGSGGMQGNGDAAASGGNADGRGDGAPGGTSAGGRGSGGSNGTGGGTGMSGTGGSTKPDGGAGAAGGASGNEATFVPDPGWACGMADGIAPPTQGQLAFSISFQISGTHDVGNTPYGHRRLLDVKGGTITGDRLKGTVNTGGLEYELTLSNGVVEFQGINILKTSDNSLIYVRSCGVSPDASSTPRVIPDFEAATSGTYAWLNTGKFVATRTLDAAGGTLKLDVYDVSKVTVGEPRIQITKPAGVPKQPWECNTTTGTKGSSVFTENVSLGSSISIANAKRGSRNIIPITGGTTTGQVAGAILNGGADYQLSGSLDAWYTLAPSNGEFILVRNCGPMGKLIPWFEARTDGDYKFLNANTFISSDPGSGGGGVSITFYERK